MSLTFDLIAQHVYDPRFPYWIFYDLCMATLPELNEEVILVAYECLRNNESSVVEYQQ